MPATRVSIPISSLGLSVVFDDGARTLSYSDSYKIGSQSFTSSPVTITSAPGSIAPSGTGDPAVQSIIYMNQAGLSGGAEPDLVIKGKAKIFGTTSVDVIAVLPGSDLVFDGSFNRGGDVIVLTKPAAEFSAVRINAGTLLINSIDSKLTLPVGSTGLTLQFTDGARVLIYKNGSFHIGDQAFTSNVPVSLTASLEDDSLDQGTMTTAAVIDASGANVFRDDVTKYTNVVLTNFGSDDVIRIFGDTVNSYQFSVSTRDPRDLVIWYWNDRGARSGYIVLDDILNEGATVDSYDSAVSALGWNFMTIG